MKKLAAVIFPGFELLDVFGPLEMFGVCVKDYEVCLVAEQAGPVASSQGPVAEAAHGFDNAPAFDLILVPGGRGTRREVDNARLVDWIAGAADRAELVLTVCTGTSLLARTGLLDGRQATTNKIAFDWVAGQSDKVEWVRQARWVEDGKYWTSSGVSAGMDMSLAVLAHLKNQEFAEQVAVWTEYDWHRDPACDPFAEIHGLV